VKLTGYEAARAEQNCLIPALAATLALGLDAITVAGNVGGGVLLLLVVPLEVEGDGLALVQGAETLGIDGGLMDENILRAISGGDEAETLLGVEKFDGSLGSHLKIFLSSFL